MNITSSEKIIKLSKSDVKYVTLGSLELVVLENGYFNASKICCAHNKYFADWSRTETFRTAIKEAAKYNNLSENQIIIQITKTDNELKGTYLHPSLLLPIAIWCDTKYSIELSSAVWGSEETNSTNGYDKNFIVDTRKSNEIKTGLYLIRIGSVGILRQKLAIPNEYLDNYDVYKFGRSVDINKRHKNHTKKFGTITELVYYVNIPTKILPKAELHLRDIFISSNIKFTHQKHQELIIIPQNLLVLVKCAYNSVELEFKQKML